jgi:hypothetical protein
VTQLQAAGYMIAKRFRGGLGFRAVFQIFGCSLQRSCLCTPCNPSSSKGLCLGLCGWLLRVFT